MPATVRDILLMIRAKEDATRTLNKVAGSMRGTAAAADAASARARAAALRAQAQQAKLAGATKQQVAAIQAQAKAYDDQAKKLDSASKQSKAFATQLSDVGRTMEIVGISAMAGGAAVAYGLKQAVDVAAEWDRQVRLTYTQVDKKFKPSLQELSAIGLRVSKDIAVPFEQVQGALFDVFSSTEANLPQAEALLRSFAKAAVAGQTDIQTASRATIGLMNAFKLPFSDVNKILDIQFELVKEGVGTYEEWANRIGLVSPSAVRAGQSIDMMAAALSTATRLGMNAARASTSVARAFDAMSNPKTEKALKKLGIATRDAKGQFRPMVDVLADWKKQLDGLPEKDKVAEILDVMKGAGGTIEARRFLQQILLSKGGLELFQSQVKSFAKDKGAFANAYNDMANSVSSKTQLLHNAWMQLKLGIGQALLPMFSQLVGYLQRLANWFNALPQSTKETIAKFGVLASVLLIVGGALTTVVGIFLSFAGIIAAAGPALLPLIGSFGLIAAGATAAVAALVGLGAAFVIAYKKSASFRLVLTSIGEVFAAAWVQVKTFAMGVWSAFQANVLPALQALWVQIQSNVFPALTQLAVWAKANLIPIMQQVGEWIQNRLKPAFENVATAIRTQLIPAIQEMSKWWDENKATILPVIKVLGMLVGVLVAAAASTIPVFINMLAALIGAFRALVKVVTTVWNQIKSLVTAVVNQCVSAGHNFMSNMHSIASTAQSVWNTIKSVWNNGIKTIKAAFNGAGSWLINAGKNIVEGLINGIRGRIGAAASEAANLAKNVLNSAMHALGIHSPSTKFKDIGMDIVRGLTLGIQASSTQKQLQNAMYKLTRDVQRSINAADISKSAKRAMAAKWNTRLASTTAKLNALETKRLALQTKLAAAQKSVNDQIKARDELSSKISDAVKASADLTTLSDDQKTSGANMVKALQDRLAAVKKFQQELRDLAQRGLDKDTIAQLAQQGVDAAGTLVDTLAHSSQADLQNISKLQNQIRTIGNQTGTNVAGDLYNAGIKAGQGLIKGLQSQIGAITKQMAAIAAALVKQIKKELGIKSPSRVFREIGVNTARGYVNGYVDKINRERANMANATMFSPNSTRMSSSGTGYGNTYQRTYDQKITVNTQEIDPRKQAAALGWELQGRLP